MDGTSDVSKNQHSEPESTGVKAFVLCTSTLSTQWGGPGGSSSPPPPLRAPWGGMGALWGPSSTASLDTSLEPLAWFAGRSLPSLHTPLPQNPSGD